jgi:hypothetical protein
VIGASRSAALRDGHVGNPTLTRPPTQEFPQGRQILGERGRSLGDATIFHYCEWLKKVAPSLPDHEKWERRETFTHP